MVTVKGGDRSFYKFDKWVARRISRIKDKNTEQHTWEKGQGVERGLKGRVVDELGKKRKEGGRREGGGRKIHGWGWDDTWKQ